MARRMFTVVDVVELLRHWDAGDNVSQMARALGLDRKTVRKYVGRAEAAGLAPGGAPFSAAEWAARVREWFPELTDPRARSSVHGQIASFHDYIEKHLATTTLATIHQRLRDEHGLSVSVASLRRYVHVEFAELGAEEQATVLREDPPPGAEAQLDYGHLGSWCDPATGARQRVWGFIMVLAFSRHLFCYPVLRMTQREFLAAHVAAFEFFGGCPARLVPDNLGSGVLKPDLYDPRLNRGYAELSHHYGCLVDPARVAHPKDKPRVERMVPYVRDSFFSGREFAGLSQMRIQAASWSLGVAGQRAARPLGGAKPAVVFAALEAEHLLALPARPFEAATWQTAKVSPDCHICVGGALYSVPFRFIGARLDVRLTDAMLFAYATCATVLSAALCIATTIALFGTTSIGPFVATVALYLAFVAMMLLLTIMLACAMKSQGPVIGLAVAVLVCLLVLSGFPLIRDHSPAGVVTAYGAVVAGGNAALLWPLLTTAIAGVLLLGAAVWFFQRGEL